MRFIWRALPEIVYKLLLMIVIQMRESKDRVPSGLRGLQRRQRPHNPIFMNPTKEQLASTWNGRCFFQYVFVLVRIFVLSQLNERFTLKIHNEFKNGSKYNFR